MPNSGYFKHILPTSVILIIKNLSFTVRNYPKLCGKETSGCWIQSFQTIGNSVSLEPFFTRIGFESDDLSSVWIIFSNISSVKFYRIKVGLNFRLLKFPVVPILISSLYGIILTQGLSWKGCFYSFQEPGV